MWFAAVPRMGPVATALEVFNALRQYRSIDTALLCGIGAGRRDHIALGDLVIATEVLDMDSRKIAPDAVQYRGAIHDTDAVVVPALKAWSGKDRWIADATDWRKPRASRAAIHFAPIASGSRLDAAESVWPDIISRHDKALAYDMESSGFVKACQRAGVTKWLVAKAISDFGGEDKSDL
jgi:nucleoside phosphorylase